MLKLIKYVGLTSVAAVWNIWNTGCIHKHALVNFSNLLQVCFSLHQTDARFTTVLSGKVVRANIVHYHVDNQWDAYICLKSFNPDIHIDMHTKTKIFLSSKISGYSIRLSHSYPCLGLSTALGSYDSWKSMDFGSGQ